jgi:hypothetical protein
MAKAAGAGARQEICAESSYFAMRRNPAMLSSSTIFASFEFAQSQDIRERINPISQAELHIYDRIWKCVPIFSKIFQRRGARVKVWKDALCLAYSLSVS